MARFKVFLCIGVLVIWSVVQAFTHEKIHAANPVDTDGVAMLFPQQSGRPSWNLGTRDANSTVGTYFSMNGDKATGITEGAIKFWRLNGHKVSYASGIPDGITTRIHIRSGESQKYTWKNGAVNTGYLGGPKDLKNFEATIYVRVSGDNKTHKSMSWKIRGGAHSGDQSSCVGMNVPYTGQGAHFNRELTHPNYEYVKLNPSFEYNLQEGKWVGVKIVSYVLPDGKSVENLLYLDTAPYNASGKPVNNWQLYTEWVDRTGHSTGKYTQAATWGGVVNTFRVDGWKNVDFSILSAREIVPPSNSPISTQTPVTPTKSVSTTISPTPSPTSVVPTFTCLGSCPTMPEQVPTHEPEPTHSASSGSMTPTTAPTAGQPQLTQSPISIPTNPGLQLPQNQGLLQILIQLIFVLILALFGR